MMKQTMTMLVLFGALVSCGESHEDGDDDDSGNGGSSGAGGTGGSGGGYSPATVEAWNEYCALRDERLVTCDIPLGSCATADCIEPIYEEAPLLDYIACQSAKTCDEFGSDDDCLEMAGGGLSGERLAFGDACVAKTTECFGDASDFCAAALPMIRRSIMNAVDACLARPCAELEACFDAIVVPDCWGEET